MIFQQMKFWLGLAAAIAVTASSPATSQAQNRRAERMIRVVWQDGEKQTMQWGEFVQIGRNLHFQNGGEIAGLPKLDAEQQRFVQMERVEDVLVVGVRDDHNGEHQSGWVAVDLGVDEHPHGDHSDFDYRNHPRVLASVLDQAQGNPAHLYVYDQNFYLANDKLNGFTRLDPKVLRGPEAERKGTFHRGGGGHITLAAVNNRVAYSTWAGGRGAGGTGKIDVVDLSKTGEESIAYTFELPSGGLHGAIANSGRVFFAPADGIYWVDADLELKGSAETVAPKHIPLGKNEENDRPYRTGAFTNLRNWVIFNTGTPENPILGLINASAAEPTLVQVSIPAVNGLSLVSPDVIRAANGKHYAFIFQDRREGDIQEHLVIVDLDPNNDLDFSDAKVAKTLNVGNSKVAGHNGHHAIAFDDDYRFGVFTNPGDGDLGVMWLNDLTIIGNYKVGGMPTKIISVGGEESKH